MPKLTIANLQNKPISWEDKKSTLLKVILSETDWMHACGAKGRCTSCRAIIVSGSENLPSKTAAEERFANQGKLLANERLTCQLVCDNDVEIAVPRQTQLPHLKYDY